MATTHCGKSCAECMERAKLHCPGCKAGPGKPYSCDCGIATCCLSRGLTTCEECTTASTCFQWKHRFDVQAERVRRMEADAVRQIELAEKNDMLAKWLWGLFWLVIVSLVINTVFDLVEALPGMKVTGELITAAFNIGYAFILVKMSGASYCFKVSGICKLICVAFSLIGLIFTDTIFATLFVLTALVPSFVAQYQEYMGYSEVTEEMDEDLSRRWRIVWFLSLGGLIGMFVGLLLSLFGALLGALLLIVAAVAVLVAEILKMVFLYKTAQYFRATYC